MVHYSFLNVYLSYKLKNERVVRITIVTNIAFFLQCGYLGSK